MLKLQKISEPLRENIELDDYLPIIIRWDHNQSMVMDWLTLYWSISNEKSLLEIGLDEYTHTIKIFKVVFVDQVIINHSQTSPDLPIYQGLPVLSIENCEAGKYLKQYYFRKAGRFEFYLGDNYLKIILNTQKTLYQIVSGRSKFSIDENSCLASLDVSGFSKQDMEQMIETLKHGQATISNMV